MNLYNIFRMFVKKNIWKNKKIQSKRLSDNCKNSDYPNHIISYQGAAHKFIYREFIINYFDLPDNKFYYNNSGFHHDNDDYRYSRIKCEIKNGTIMPKFYNED